jgi:hypothetical protein
VSKKIIITNKTALLEKYNSIEPLESEINNLITEDAKKGITTILKYIDDANQMKIYGTKPVTDKTDEKQNKAAIDTVYNAEKPAYMLLIDGPDVIPHQKLKNPVEDADSDIPSDLPYACDNPYSKEPNDFAGPTRVIGRLPGMTLSNDVDYLTQLIKNSVSFEPVNKSDYMNYFSISAHEWEDSTGESVENIFGNKIFLNLVPPNNDNWADKQLNSLIHFVNCHGKIATPKWYGQQESEYPVALEADLLAGKILKNTIVASECCYGALLYPPENAGHNFGESICNTYLGNNAIGFLGSTTLAYGPSSGQGQADLIAQYFLINILQGQSLGHAFLEARQKFIQNNIDLSPMDIKTLSQFILLGDPSTQPVAKPKSATIEAESNERNTRRQRLMLTGSFLKKNVGISRKSEKISLKGNILSEVNAIKEKMKIIERKTISYEIDYKGQSKAIMKSIKPRYHLIHGEILKDTEIPNEIILVVREVDEKNYSIEYLYRH